jgi:pheromone shutdown protein TraB
MENYKRVMVIGENHGNLSYTKEEARIIRDFKPEFILYEGFTDHSEEQIRRFVDDAVWFLGVLEKELPEKKRCNLLLLRAFKDSEARLFGCDSIILQREQKSYDITFEDCLRGEEYVEEKRRKFFETNRKRSNYMSSHIIESAQNGDTLAIIGNGHFDEVMQELQSRRIQHNYISLGNHRVVQCFP